jgi:hypothetical protein
MLWRGVAARKCFGGFAASRFNFIEKPQRVDGRMAARANEPPARQNRFGEKVAKKAKKSARRTWSKDDVKTLKAMARSKAGVRKIAKALKRTPGATTVKAAKLGISLSMS